MKILHTSDWHLGAYVGPQQDDPYKRTENTRKCIDIVVKAAREEQPDIILITGDIFHQSRTWSDRGMIEAQIAIDYIETLASYAPVAVLYGTPNHDNLEAFKMLEQAFGKDSEDVHFFYGPELRTIITPKGPIQIGSLPGFDKGHFRATHPGLSAEEENKLFSELLTQIIEGYTAQLNPFEPAVLMAHHTVIGCEMDNGYNVFQANEVTLNSEALNRCGFDLVCLGHIHKAQKVTSCDRPIFYAGSIDAYNFNDEGHEKGFWIHNVVDTGSTWKYRDSRFIQTPAREFYTGKLNQDKLETIIAGDFNYFGVEGKCIRILYSCSSDTEKALDKKKLERDLYAAGAYYVTEIRPEKIEASVNRESMHEKMSVADCLIRYLEEKGYPDSDPETEDLYNTAMPLLLIAQASMPSAGQTGFFLPLEIEVKNYRSYKEEKLDFSDIFFAMVNGENGSGKSSLFMDAPCDCLYEQPREGDLTGWIRAGEKSGSISFTFILGHDTWRVTRTRQRSGKATLSLAKLVSLENQWEDHSCQKLIDTQQKIVDLLGMDCSTFQSCVLIMQDKYGIFMEAKPEDRMGILANLLGLGIYEMLEGLAKEKLTETNREIRNLKEQLGELAADLEQKVQIVFSKDEAEKELKALEAQLNEKKIDVQDLQQTISDMERIDDEISKLTKEAALLMESKSAKKQRLEKLNFDAERTRDFLENEGFFIEQHNRYEDCRCKLTELEGKQLLLNEKKKNCEEAQFRADKLMKDIKELQWIIEHTVDRSSEKQAMEAFIRENEDIEAKISAQKELAKASITLNKKFLDIEYSIEQAERKRDWNKNKGAERIESLKQKAAMLENSSCIDPEKAQCRFLADAKAAKASIPAVESENAENERKATAEINQLIETKECIESDIEKLGYNPLILDQLSDIYSQCSEYKTQLVKIEAADAKYIADKERLSEAEKQCKELLESIETANIELKEIESQCADYPDLKYEMEQLQHDEEKYHKIPAGKEFLKAIEPQIEELTEDIKNLDMDINQKMKSAQEMTNKIIEIVPLRDKLSGLQYELKNLENRITAVNRAIGGYEEKLLAMKANEEAYLDKNNILTEKSHTASIYQTLAEAFSQDGIPHQIIRDIIPEIEASANEMLSQMTGGWMRVDFKTERTLKSNKNKEVATLDIMTADAYFGEMPYLSRSGGQRTRINLAVGFALAMIKASRVGLQLGMMFVDEPSWLDNKGTEEYCTALQAIHNKYSEMRIVAISHDASMKMNFPQQIWVELTEEGSKIRRV
jgi:exonuclease SbcC